MTSLAEWLLAAIADDEQVARAVLETRQSWTFHPDIHRTPNGDQINDPWLAIGGTTDATADTFDGFTSAELEHIARWDPKRAIDECAAKRRIVAEHCAYDWPGSSRRHCMGCGFGSDEEPRTEDINDCPVLLALALPYASRDGYQAEWAL